MTLDSKNKLSLTEALQQLYPMSSKNSIRSWIKQGRVLINNYPVLNPFYSIKDKSLIKLQDKIKHADFKIEIIYEDKHLIVVKKPPYLLSVSTAFEYDQTVFSVLKKRVPYKRVFPVHRLDREASGLMIFAYGHKARNLLKKQLEHHLIQRDYLAIVSGIVKDKKGTWKSYLKENKKNYMVFSHPQGKRAITHFEKIHEKENTTALKLSLETGRKNQIRCQASEAGFPILGDTKYGALKNSIKRLALHAYQLTFHHPITNKKMYFKSSFPASFKPFFENFL